eukprot:6057373-Amphidinium_carterae.4
MHGGAGRREPPRHYVLKVIQLTLWMLAKPKVALKHVQILAGRWVRCLQQRLACLGVFNALWTWMQQKGPALSWTTAVIDELMLCMISAPWCSRDL